MNYQGLEVASNRILHYAQDLCDNESGQYASTKAAVVRSYNNVKKALELLEDSMKKNHIHISKKSKQSKDKEMKSDELVESSSAMVKTIETLAKTVNELTQRVDEISAQSKAKACEVIESVKDSVIPDEYDPKASSQIEVVESKRTIRSKDLRKKMRLYHKYIAKLPEDVKTSVGDYEELTECVELIKYWFEHRFHPQHYPCNGFCADKMNEWVQTIIFAYCHAYDVEHSTHNFVQNFKNWCDEISAPDAKNPYVLPYDVYQYIRDIPEDCLNPHAICMLNMLICSDVWCNLSQIFYTENTLRFRYYTTLYEKYGVNYLKTSKNYLIQTYDIEECARISRFHRSNITVHENRYTLEGSYA